MRSENGEKFLIDAIIYVCVLYDYFRDLREDDTDNRNPEFIKTDYNSGDMANIILMQRKIKQWVKKAKHRSEM